LYDIFLTCELSYKITVLLEEFFGNTAKEIGGICQEYLAITPSWNVMLELVYSTLESVSMIIPTEDEIAANLKPSIDSFIRRISTRPMRVRTIAPLVGCSFDDSLDLEGVSFRKMNRDDIATMAMIEWNLSGGDMTQMTFDYRDSVIVLDHSFDMVINPHDYSLNESMDRLHNSFKDRCHKALAAIRLVESKRIGFNQMYHLDPIWVTLDSFRFITEDAPPIYRPFRFGKHISPRDEFYLPRKNRDKDSVTSNYKKLDRLYAEISIHTHYSYLTLAFQFYSKSMEEYEIGWALLDLVIALESLCYFRKTQMNDTGLCDSAGAINRALGSYTKAELVRKAYEARSRKFAHSPQPEVVIDPTLLADLREFTRTTLLKILEDTLP
jgi:hypothetical protein